MFQQIGLALVAFFIAYLCFIGVFTFLKDNYGIEIPLGEGLFISENRGEDWVVLKAADKTDKDVNAENLAFDPQNPQNLYLASAKGIFESLNKGENFTAKATQFKTETQPSLVSNFTPDPQNPNTLYLISEEIGQNKLLVSHNKGKDFSPIFIAGNDDKISAFSVDPFYSNWLYLGTKQGGFLKSEDFGNSWKEKNKFSQPVEKIVPNPHKQGEIYILLSRVPKDPFNVYSNGLPTKGEVSSDGGKTFQNLEEKIDISKVKKEIGELPEIKNIVIDSSQDRVYFISDYYLLRVAQNKMELVKIVSPSKENKITAFTIDPKNSNILYLGMGNLIYLSENDGENWQIIEPPTRGEIEGIKINPADPNTILLSIKKTF
jgi:hypothetical protein